MGSWHPPEEETDTGEVTHGGGTPPSFLHLQNTHLHQKLP